MYNNNIKEIEAKDSFSIIENYVDNDENINVSLLGKYYFKDRDVYIAIDNSIGECYVEEFDTLSECMAYLGMK